MNENKIIPVTRENLDAMSKAAAKWGMPRSARWLERCMFDPTVEDLIAGDACRGHMSVRDDGEPVAVQGYYYMPGYFRQKKILINTGCIMGADSKYGEELLCCLDANKETNRLGQMSASNCLANEKSAKITRVCSRMEEEPRKIRERRFAVTDATGYAVCVLQYLLKAPMFVVNVVWIFLRPVSWAAARVQFLLRPRRGYALREMSSFRTNKYEEFWRAFLAGNDGVITSREPERMAWLFDDSLKAGTVRLVGAFKDGDLRGYVLIRRMPMANGRIARDWQICDICALGNDERCLNALAHASLSCASRHGGLRVLFYGALPGVEKWLHPVLARRRLQSHPAFMYRVHSKSDPAIRESLLAGKGWFFGPLDGERCLGNGGYVDL